MLSIPRTSDANDLSSICNYADESTPSQNGGATPQGEKSMYIEDTKFDYRDEAIPFITIDENTKQFKVHPQAVKLLESIEGDLGVVTIAGPYRTGKSSLVGRALLSNPKAFQAGATVNPCTKGLWIYATPITDCKKANGEPMTAVIIDSEGLNAIDECESHDLRIMTLSLLLSSKLIYNSMNAIDEQSLQQLNLVVNLTKHIQLRSSSFNGEFQDPEELAKIFPSFLWLVRDFNLALVDQKGAPITPKEYIELALQEQNGMSERTETKNRTRRLFKTLFTDRDCMVFERPISDETQLQQLQDVPNDDLKPNFVRQLESLKKRVLGKMQAKTIHGRTINGRVLANLAHQYIQAFNQGAMPNIESAWTYICRDESMKALAQAREHFQKAISDSVVLPCSLFDLECDYKEAKQSTLKLYKANAISGDDTLLEGEKSIRLECKNQLEQLKIKNDEACASLCKDFLNQYHKELMQGLYSADGGSMLDESVIQNLNQVEQALQGMEQTFEQTGPQGDENIRNLIYEKFRSQVAFESGHHFTNLLKVESQLKSNLLEEKCKSLKSEVELSKQEVNAEMDKMREEQRAKDRETCEVKAQHSLTLERIASIESQAKITEADLQTQMDSDKRKLQSQVAEAKEMQQQAENEQQRVSRQMVEVTSKLQKEKELVEQELEHFKKQECELRVREKELCDQLDKAVKTSLDERNQREQSLIRQLNEAISAKEELMETAQDLTEQMENSNKSLKELHLRLSHTEKRLQTKLSQAEAQASKRPNVDSNVLLDLQNKLDEAQAALKSSLEVNSELKGSKKTEIAKIVNEKDISIAQREKQLAVIKQKESQQCERICQLEKQVESSKSQTNSMLSQLEAKSQNEKSAVSEQQTVVDTIQKSHQDEIDRIEEAHRLSQQEIADELTQAKSSMEEDSLKSKLGMAELQMSIDELRDQVDSTEKENERLMRQCKVQKERNDSILESLQSKSSQSVVELSHQHDLQISELEITISETQEQAKQELAKLKINFEKDIAQVTHKWQEDKEKLKSEEKFLRDEYEARLNEDEQKFDEERLFLQSQLSQLQFESQAQLDKVQRDLMLLRNEHENLMTIHSEKVEQHRLMEQSNSAHQQSLMEKHSEIVTSLQVKAETVSLNLAHKEQALISANLSLQASQADLMRKKSQFTLYQEETKAEICKLEDKIGVLREENQNLKDSLQGRNMDFSKNDALKQQSIGFLERKLEDQQAMADTRQRELDDQIQNLKAERTKQLLEQSCDFKEQKRELEAKFEARRKAMKAQQVEHNAKMAEYERKNVLLTQQVQSDQRLANEQITDLQLQLDKASVHMIESQEQAQFELQSTLEKSSELKLRVQELEKENQGLVNEIEKDRALFEDKINFLKDQKVRLDSDRQESERKLKEEQENLLRIRNQEKEKATKNRQECVTHLETYYKSLTQRLQDEAKKTTDESHLRVKSLQTQAKELSTQLEIVKREKDAGFKASIERQDKQDKIEAALRLELSCLKKSLETAQAKNEEKIEQLRDSTKAKVGKAEKERKDIELTQTTLRHNFSMEEAKQNMKQEQLQNEIQQLAEEGERLQKKTETLLRENQKLRTSQRSQFQQSVNFSSSRSSTFMNNLASSQLAPTSSRGVESSTTSSIAPTSTENSAIVSKHTRNQTTLGSSAQSAGMTKVATFMAKSNGGTALLTKSIKESMAKCSPTKERPKVVSGAASLMTSRNLSLKSNMLIQGVSKTQINKAEPFKVRENNLFKATFDETPQPFTVDVQQTLKHKGQPVDENSQPRVDQEQTQEFQKSTAMTIDELIATTPEEQQ